MGVCGQLVDFLVAGQGMVQNAAVCPELHWLALHWRWLALVGVMLALVGVGWVFEWIPYM